jgi:hypothetical protein
MKLIGDIQEELGLTLGRMGKYRVLLFFEDNFSASRMNRGIITMWLSGSPQNAEGDVLLYECPGKGCATVLPPGTYNFDMPTMVCPECLQTFHKDEMIPGMAYDATVDGWSRHLARYLRALEMDADIYIKRAKRGQSIIDAAAQARAGRAGAALLDQARIREDALYTAGRIIKDTHSNRSLESVIKAFLLA